MTIETNAPEKSSDGLCSIREAVENAEANSATHSDCPAGTGTDTINLDGREIIFTDGPAAYDVDGSHNALEPLDDAAGLTIANGTLTRSYSTNCSKSEENRAMFRFFRVRSGAALSLRDVVVQNGCASDVDSFSIEDDKGGAIYATEATLTIRRSTFIDNDAFEGAVVFAQNPGDTTVLTSEIRDNKADDGPGIAQGGGVLDFENGNSHVPTATIVVARNAFYDNEAKWAINLRDGDETWIVNNTIVSNDSRGVYMEQDLNSVVLAHNTIAGNAQTGLELASDVTGTIAISGNVIGGNDVDGGSNDCAVGTVAGEARRNAFGIAGDARGCSGFALEVANLVPSGPLESIVETTAGDPIPADHGGPTPTVRVPSSSPTIDASNALLLPDETAMGVDIDLDGPDDPIDVDQRGAIRVVGTAPDMGATENNLSTAYAAVPVMGGGAQTLFGLVLVFTGIHTLRLRHRRE